MLTTKFTHTQCLDGFSVQTPSDLFEQPFCLRSDTAQVVWLCVVYERDSVKNVPKRKEYGEGRVKQE